MRSAPDRILARRVRDLDVQDDHALVHHVVVLDIADQRRGHEVGVAGQEHPGARHAVDAGDHLRPVPSAARASLASAARSSSRPLRQVVKITHSTAPRVSGIQPPLGTLVMLPATKTPSHQQQAEQGHDRHSGQSHCVAATNAPRMVVMNIVPTTAAP